MEEENLTPQDKLTERCEERYICELCGAFAYEKERYERHLKLPHPKKP